MVLVFICLMLPPAGSAQECEDDLGGFRLASIEPGTDGVREVFYAYRDDTLQQQVTPPAQIQSAMETAAEEWNAGASSTKVRFLPWTGTEPLNLVIAPWNSSCIAVDSYNGILRYNSTFAQMASEEEELAAAAFMHELGHYLGLADAGTSPSSPTIMENPTGSCASPQLDTLSVQEGDVLKAGQCTVEIIEQSTVEFDDYEEVWDEWLFCWHYYLVVHHYACGSAGCVYLYSDAPVYLGSSCW